MVLPGVQEWTRHHQAVGDWALAVVLVAFSASQGAAVIVVSVLLAATVVARHRYPVPALGAGVALALAQLAAGLPPVMSDLALVVLLYTVAASRPRRISVPGLAVCLLIAALALLRWAPAYHGPLDAAVAGVGGLALTAWVLGDSMAYRRAYYAGLEERAARLEAERDAQARIAAAAERARELEERRARVVDESAARLRRIERDLHDGAQVRLAALAMSLGEIKESLEAGQWEHAELADAAAGASDLSSNTSTEPRSGSSFTGHDTQNPNHCRLSTDWARGGQADRGGVNGVDGPPSGMVGPGGGGGGRLVELVAAAHASAKEALAELRDLARGIHPPVLDRGLDAALAALAEASATPAELSVAVAERPSPAIEAIVYFCAAELLANIAKHSGASQAAIAVRAREQGAETAGAAAGRGGLTMTVTDDGAGQARLVPGGGLAGLRERARAVDGRLALDSPAGGPTVVTIELPDHA